MTDSAEKMRRCHDYVEALEEERRKIQVFRRELPLCLELVTQAIETCKNQFSPAATTTDFMHEQSECSEHTSGHRPVLEEFIPMMKKTAASSPEHRRSDDEKKKSDWLRSAQLWNQSPDPEIEHKVAATEAASVVEVKRNGGGFQNSEKSNGPPACKTPSFPPAAATSSSAETDKDEQAQRKQRRCWSPELHRRFLHALQQLGGSHSATPKQIRELMKVEGLTNDEVKSHLQKYRLHTRRPSSGVHNNAHNLQAPQFLVVGGIWVPPAAAPPLPTTVPHPSRPRQEQSEERRSHSGRGMHSHSPATSSSTHTTTAL